MAGVAMAGEMRIKQADKRDRQIYRIHAGPHPHIIRIRDFRNLHVLAGAAALALSVSALVPAQAAPEAVSTPPAVAGQATAGQAAGDVTPRGDVTLDIEYQFFYGRSLLVSPVLEENSTSVNYYLPKDNFYDFFTGKPVVGEGAQVTQDNVNYTDIPVHIRGGSIVPLRVDGANTTKQLRDIDFELLIAPDADGSATGRLYLDDGSSIAPSEISEIQFTCYAMLCPICIETCLLQGTLLRRMLTL